MSEEKKYTLEQVLEESLKDTVKECLKVLDRYYWDGVANMHVADKEGAYFSVTDIEELFDIELK